MSKILLQDIYPRPNYCILYELLKERTKNQSISHKKIPTYEEHKNFVDTIPYNRWFFILCSKSKEIVGSVYISNNNEIGLFIFKRYKNKGYGTDTLKSIINNQINRVNRNELKANINPNNKKSINLFKKLGFKHIQNTYKLSR